MIDSSIQSQSSYIVSRNGGDAEGFHDGENEVDMSSMEPLVNINSFTSTLWNKEGRGDGRYSQQVFNVNCSPLDSLQHQFTYHVQCMKSRYEVFAVIDKWTEQIYITLDAFRSEDVDLPDTMVKNLERLLEKEAKTWNLLMRLYFYRLQSNDEEMEEELQNQLQVERINEQPIVNIILETNQELHEINIILKWLEASYAENSEPDLIPRFVSWEQTLEALKRDRMLKKSTNENMVAHMDPDACLREKKELHILDLEEESKVQRGTYYYIRSGKHNEALAFLNESAHIAKAASLNGGRYTEKVPCNADSTMDSSHAGGDTVARSFADNNSTIKYRVMGNLRRDLWKKMAFNICETKKQTKHDRATLGALCGHRQSMLDAAISWEDKLWAYIKCLSDVRVEEELRKRSSATYLAMPDEYWSQKISLSECLERIEAEETGININQNVGHIFNIVQRKIMLDNVNGLMQNLKDCIPQFLRDGSDHVLVGQVSRFLTHMIVVLGIMDIPYDEELMDMCSEKYIGALVASKQLIYIPFYVTCMTQSRQIPVILDQIDPNINFSSEDISTFIQTAAANNLNVLSIGVAIVEKLFREQDDFNTEGLLWISECYLYVEDNSQVMLALLRHTLIISRKYLVLGNIPKVQELMNLINQQCITQVVTLSDHYKDTLIREYICYKSYMEGEDYLEMWKRAMAQRPTIDSSSFSTKGMLTDRILTEKKSRDFDTLESKWKKAVGHYLGQTIETFMKLLKFPDGWLLDCIALENEDEDLLHVNGVRKIILPKVVFLLIKLIQESSKSSKQMRELLYVLCEDQRQILKEFSPSGIASIFKAIEKSTRAVPTNVDE